jgi:hypothetical protein
MNHLTDLILMIGLPLILVGVLVVIANVWVKEITDFFQERRFQKQMQEQGRFINWNDLVVRLEDGQGTIIVEGQHKMPYRVWWTQENVPALYPQPLPTEQELSDASMDYYCTDDETHPFMEWCFTRYLHPDNGLASLTNPPVNIMKEVSGFDSAQLFKVKFPNIQAIDTVRRMPR